MGDRILAVINTLQQLEIRATESNMDKMLGCLMELRKIEKELNEQKSREDEWNVE